MTVVESASSIEGLRMKEQRGERVGMRDRRVDTFVTPPVGSYSARKGGGDLLYAP